MGRFKAIILATGLLCLFFGPDTAQAEDFREKRVAECSAWQERYGEKAASLAADEEAQNRFATLYEAVTRFAMIEAACEPLPPPEENEEENPAAPLEMPENTWSENGKTASAAFAALLAEGGEPACSAVYENLLPKVTQAREEYRLWNQSARMTLGSARRITALLVEACPESQQELLNGLSGDLETLSQRADAWPVCADARDEVRTVISSLDDARRRPGTDIQFLIEARLDPVAEKVQKACSVESSWLSDVTPAIAKARDTSVDDSADIRNGCTAAMGRLGMGLRDIRDNARAYRPGCDSHDELLRTYYRIRGALERDVGMACSMFPGSITDLQGGLETEKRLIDELGAEDRILRYRLEQGDTAAVSCEQP